MSERTLHDELRKTGLSSYKRLFRDDPTCYLLDPDEILSLNESGINGVSAATIDVYDKKNGGKHYTPVTSDEETMKSVVGYLESKGFPREDKPGPKKKSK